MSRSLNTNKRPDDRKWTCDDCGAIFSEEYGSVHAGFGLCNSCIGYDWKKRINIPTTEQLIVMKKREEFSDLEHINKLRSISADELINLKEEYDKDFIKYWSVGRRDFPKYQPVSIEVFIERLRNKGFFEKYGRLKR